MKKFLLLSLIVLLCLAGCGAEEPAAEMPADFSFSLVWGTFGIHSYDSVDGTLVKSDAEPDKDAYRTTLILSDEQRRAAWEVIAALDWEKYTSDYDPNPDVKSAPSADIILTVTENGRTHSVRCRDIALGYSSDDPDGQAFLNAVRKLEEILTTTAEWEALPDYTVLFC